VIDQRKQGDLFRLQDILEPIHRLVDRVLARDIDDASPDDRPWIRGHMRHVGLRLKWTASVRIVAEDCAD
jgi:hypothetical protein